MLRRSSYSRPRGHRMESLGRGIGITRARFYVTFPLRRGPDRPRPLPSRSRLPIRSRHIASWQSTPGSPMPFPALLELAVGGAAIAVHEVAVVTLLALEHTEAAVPAAIEQAPRAAVAGRRIPVLALLPGVDHAVPAVLELAVGVAAIAGDAVAVVALLAPVRAEAAVPADIDPALRAAVARRRIAVVALLLGLDDAVPAVLEPAVGGAAIAVHEVAVVALLALEHTEAPVPAAVEQAPRAAVAGRRIPVLALLPGVDHAVPAVLELAVGVAAIAGDAVAVVALLAPVRAEAAVPADIDPALRAAVARRRIAVVALLLGLDDAVPA